jgi:hypothetical protein
MKTLTLEFDDYGCRPLRCPRCGNRGERPFSAVTLVLIGVGGMPDFLSAYPEWDDPNIDCLGCDYRGPVEVFTERHRPGDRRRHRPGTDR